MIAAPVSANMASHRLDRPISVRPMKATLMTSEKVTFCQMMPMVRRPRRMRYSSRVRSLDISAMSAVSMAVSEPVAPMAMPMFASASAGASLTPSPTMATWPYFRFSSVMRLTLSWGSRPA